MKMKKRLRIFAGPNGSGKSTILSIVRNENIHLGVYVNADDLKRNINASHRFDFSEYNCRFDFLNFTESFRASALFGQADGTDLLQYMRAEGDILYFDRDVNDYFTSFLAAFLRENLLECGEKFTFETVMSHRSKLDFLQKARNKGFRIYLYYVSLENPLLNKARVASRVLQGGHDVPEDKIVERYNRSMDLLLEAIRLSDRVYLFDNSSSHPVLFAKMENGELSVVDGIQILPQWFDTYVLSRL